MPKQSVGWWVAAGLMLLNIAILLSIKAREIRLAQEHVRITNLMVERLNQESEKAIKQILQLVELSPERVKWTRKRNFLFQSSQ